MPWGRGGKEWRRSRLEQAVGVWERKPFKSEDSVKRGSLGACALTQRQRVRLWSWYQRLFSGIYGCDLGNPPKESGWMGQGQGVGGSNEDISATSKERC